MNKGYLADNFQTIGSLCSVAGGFIGAVIAFIANQWFSEQRDVANLRRTKLEELWMLLVNLRTQLSLDGELEPLTSAIDMWRARITELRLKQRTLATLYFEELLEHFNALDEKFSVPMDAIQKLRRQFELAQEPAGMADRYISNLQIRGARNNLSGSLDDLKAELDQLIQSVIKQKDELINTPFNRAKAWMTNVRELN